MRAQRELPRLFLYYELVRLPKPRVSFLLQVVGPLRWIRVSQVPVVSLLFPCRGLRLRWNDAGLAFASGVVLPSRFPKTVGLHDLSIYGAQSLHLRYGLVPPSPTLHDSSCLAPCRVQYRAGGSPLPVPNFHRHDPTSFTWHTRKFKAVSSQGSPHTLDCDPASSFRQARRR